MRARFLTVLLVVLGLILGVTAQGQKEPVSSIGPAAASGELLVRFKTESSKTAINQVHSALGARVLQTFQIVPNLQLVRIPPTISLAEARTLYEKDPTVLYAEPNYLQSIAQQVALTPDDPQFSDLWALDNTGQTGGTPDADIDAPEAWDISTGSSDVVVAVIDSGAAYNHPDLTDNMWRNAPECTGTPGIDDDGNGYTDDCYGIDMANNDSDPLDDHGHGTHVAGIIGARGNNSVGVVGVNWDVQIMACKFLAANGGGFTSDAIRCLEYVKLMKERGVNIVATNNSWGGGGFSQALYDAIRAQMDAGILFIAAAGNSGANNDTRSVYPASYYLPNIIAVAATDHNDDLPSFSNFGVHTVHVGAPGKSILSTTPNNTYSTFSGTSMAAPHVTGLAALLKAHNPSFDWIAIRNVILSSGDAQSSLQGKTITGRRINAYEALTCTDAPLFAVLRPLQSTLGGAAMTIAVLNMNCASPAGSLSVTINPIGTTITLQDNGVGPDLAANDGIYSGTWAEPCAIGDTLTLDFSNGQSVTVGMAVSQSTYSCTTPPMSWRTFTSRNLNLGDDGSAMITLPFPVKFGMGRYNTLYISTNGAISFHQAMIPFNNGNLPNSSFTTLIAPFWDDLYAIPRKSNNVFWGVRGSPPNRELVIEWRDVWHLNCFLGTPSATVRFQVVFFEGRSDVLFNYQDVSLTPECAEHERGGSATIGIQVDGAHATQIGLNWPILSNNLAILWEAEKIADLAIVKSDHLDPVPVNSTLTYTLSVTNNGPDAATNVIVTDTLPEGVTFVSATPSGACAHADSVVTCTFATLADGASIAITLVTQTTTEETFTNTVTVTADTADPNPDNNSYEETTTVTSGLTCLEVTVSSTPTSLGYRPTATSPSRKSIRILLRNNSAVPRTVMGIAPLPGEPFVIERITPALPRVILPKRFQVFLITTRRDAGLGAAAAIAPYFDITLDCGAIGAASRERLLVPLRVEGVHAEWRAGRLNVAAMGTGIASLNLQLFDLSGRALVNQLAEGSALTLSPITDTGQRLANGVYLYVVTVRGLDGTVITSAVRKLVIK